MGLGKKDIAHNISTKTLLSSKVSNDFLDSFIEKIKINKNEIVKLPNFGTFFLKKSPKRIGRNPKTKDVFEIKARIKPSFKPSSRIKSILN